MSSRDPGPEDALRAGVEAGDAPFAVAMWTDGPDAAPCLAASGEASPGIAAGPDTPMRIYSMTKAVGAFALARLIDRGAVGLDQPVVEILPEFADIRVLERGPGGALALRAPRSAATVRHLATHTAGFVYDFLDAELRDWMRAEGVPSVSATGRVAGLYAPLRFDPGAAWGYGYGIDWIGRIVERVEGGPVAEVLPATLFAPLGMENTRFEPTADQADRLARVWFRGPDGFEPATIAPPAEPEMHGMGHALYATPADYMRFLRALATGGGLARPETLAALSADLLPPGAAVRPMPSAAPRRSADIDPYPGLPKTHSLFGMRLEAEGPEGRPAGTQFWAGICNTHWRLDPSGAAGLFMTQLLPFLDPRAMALMARVERAIRARAA